MRLETVNVSKLIPIELFLTAGVLEDLLNKFNPQKFEPVAGLDYNGKYLLCDGHHRAARAEFLNEQIPIKILETDLEIEKNPVGFFYFCPTRALVVSRYEQLIKPLCDQDEIFSISDLLNCHTVFKTKEENYVVW